MSWIFLAAWMQGFYPQSEMYFKPFNTKEECVTQMQSLLFNRVNDGYNLNDITEYTHKTVAYTTNQDGYPVTFTCMEVRL